MTFLLPNADLFQGSENNHGGIHRPDLGFHSPDPEGPQIELALKEKEIKSVTENALSQSLEIIRNRIDQFGVTEPTIVRQGSDEIVVQLPGVKDPQRAMDLIGRTAQLEFKLVDSRDED